MAGAGFPLFNPLRRVQWIALRQLGEGGFGSVWAGVGPHPIAVAIKVIKPTSNYARDFASWYTDQQVHLLAWNHPNVVQTYDQFVTTDGRLVIVMEMGGASLDSLIKQGRRFADKDVCAIGAQILSALAELHAKKVIHRDVTLKNIISFPNGIFKLCDFGISKPHVQPGECARTFVGAPAYIPPELHLSRYTTHVSDIYQLGLVLLTLMTGRHPIPENASPAVARWMILNGVPRRLAESLISTHGGTARILSRMLPRHEVYRYKTAAETQAAFEAEFRNLESAERRPWLPPANSFIFRN
jgi:serine/threonine protein kinase